MSFTIEHYDGSNWNKINASGFRLVRGDGYNKLGPELEFSTPRDSSILANDEVRLKVDGTVRFRGYSKSGGKFGINGAKDYKIRGRGYEIFDAELSLDLSSISPENIISNHVLDGTNYTVTTSPSTGLSIDYSCSDRKRKNILRDLLDRTGYVLRLDTVSQTFYFEDLKDRGNYGSFDAQSDGCNVVEWTEDDIDTVINKAIIYGTQQGGYKATASDGTSIDTYGEHKIERNYRYISDTTEAQDMADKLLNPNPLDNGKLRVGREKYDSSDLINYTIDVIDSSKNISSTVVVEKQVIRPGVVELFVGEGEDFSLRNYTQEGKSREDKNYPGADVTENVYPDLDSIPDGSSFGKVAIDALDNGYHTLSDAIGNLDDINDGSSFAKVNINNTDSSNYILLAESTGNLDDISDGTNYGKVKLTQLSSGEILLASAQGDLDDISDGTDYGKVKLTQLSSGEIVLASAQGDLDDISDGTDYGKVDLTYLGTGGAIYGNNIPIDSSVSKTISDWGSSSDITAIDGGEIYTGSVTTQEIQFYDGSAPTSPSNGQMWYEDPYLKFRSGGVTRTIEYEADVTSDNPPDPGSSDWTPNQLHPDYITGDTLIEQDPSWGTDYGNWSKGTLVFAKFFYEPADQTDMDISIYASTEGVIVLGFRDGRFAQSDSSRKQRVSGTFLVRPNETFYADYNNFGDDNWSLSPEFEQFKAYPLST